MKTLAATLFLSIAAPAAAMAAHPCSGEARAHADELLRFHYGSPDAPSVDVDDGVKELPPVRALRGQGSFDVLEVWGYVYKAQYRMRFIFAQIEGSCVLMGQEILEHADPY